jgi:galactokinase
VDSTSGFANAYQRSPQVVWSAPGRANLIGEHTDYNDGFVLPFAIAERTEVAAARRGDETIMVTSRGYNPAVAAVAGARRDTPGRGLGGWSAYPLGVAWAISQVRSLPPGYGVNLYIDSDVPPGAGLSSSAALEMAVAGALADLWDLDLTVPELARAGQRAENEVVGAPTGIMDQYASLLGQADAAVFLTAGPWKRARYRCGSRGPASRWSSPTRASAMPTWPAATPPAASPASGPPGSSACPRCATWTPRTCRGSRRNSTTRPSAGCGTS